MKFNKKKIKSLDHKSPQNIGGSLCSVEPVGTKIQGKAARSFLRINNPWSIGL